MSEQKGRNEMGLTQQEPAESVRGAARPNLKDPRLVLSLLEADQVVAAKTQTRFGRRPLSRGIGAMLWGLRIYVLLMLVIVALSAIQTLRGVH
jgi:hypothetical protein